MSDSLHEQIAAYVASARWFGGKGLDFRVAGIERIATLGVDPEVYVELVTVDYAGDEGSEQAPRREIYQVPVAIYDHPVERLGHALVASGDHGWAYDAVHDRDAMAHYLAAFAGGTPVAGITFERVPGYDLDTDAHSTLFSGEQSNTSIAFGEDSLLKLFRKVTPGVNPDIEIHRALTEAGSDHVAALYGWITASPGAPGGPPEDAADEVLQLGMLQQFLRTATDGWDLARASVRNLLVDETLEDIREAGGDFASESERLGVALAEVHATLSETFPASTVDGPGTADRMTERLDEAARDVPALAPYVDGVRAVFEQVRELGEVPAQRIHGDLHLGQSLRTVIGWKLVDFEGEPAKPLAERALPDSPWRDVAGMLRSFDYAGRSVAKDFVPMSPDHTADPDERSTLWSERNRGKLLHGYLGERDLTRGELALLDAYEADKAVYEVVYEARNRPTWIDIPLGALARITGGVA